MSGKIYVAATSAVVYTESGPVTIRGGVTRVREGHPLMLGRENLFRELDVHYDLEDTRSAPEEPKTVPVPNPVKEGPKAEEKPVAGLTSADAPTTPRRGSRRVTKTD